MSAALPMHHGLASAGATLAGGTAPFRCRRPHDHCRRTARRFGRVARGLPV